VDFTAHLGWPLRFGTVILALSASGCGFGDDTAGNPAARPPAGGAASVLYVTNRERLGEGAHLNFGGERGSVRYGSCTVQFEPIPLLNDLSRHLPFFVPSETHDVRPTELTTDGFWQALDTRLDSVPDRKVVLFIHGYSFGFEKGCRRTASLQRSLGSGRVVVLFSWPSDAQHTEYTADYTDMDWSVPQLAGLIAELARRFGRERLQIVGHSMGGRGLVEAIHWLQCQGAQGVVGADQVVLLAPDMDAAIFPRYLPSLRPFARRISLYVSETDTPLKVARKFHGHPRLGEAGPHLHVPEGIDVIDVTQAGRYYITGHEYYHYHPRVGADLVRLLRDDATAAERPGLHRRKGRRGSYWVLGPAGAASGG
jgi:esterase/lipase superfamily enzyme